MNFSSSLSTFSALDVSNANEHIWFSFACQVLKKYTKNIFKKHHQYLSLRQFLLKQLEFYLLTWSAGVVSLPLKPTSSKFFCKRAKFARILSVFRSSLHACGFKNKIIFKCLRIHKECRQNITLLFKPMCIRIEKWLSYTC